MEIEMKDPAKADTLDEAARNPDGTYNGYKAIEWLSSILGDSKPTKEQMDQMIKQALKK